MVLFHKGQVFKGFVATGSNTHAPEVCEPGKDLDRPPMVSTTIVVVIMMMIMMMTVIY
jgi:hypothetical protein